MKEYKPGFYYLKNKYESEPTLVRGYFSADHDNQFVFGFNAYDGGSLILLSDLSKDSVAVPVIIVEKDPCPGCNVEPCVCWELDAQQDRKI